MAFRIKKQEGLGTKRAFCINETTEDLMATSTHMFARGGSEQPKYQ